MAKQALPIKEAVSTYDREAQRPNLQVAEQERQELLKRFPLEDWPTMPLERYAQGQAGREDTFCRWLEFKSAHLAGIGGATARKFLIYKHRDKPGWYYDSATYENEQEAWQAVRGAFVRAFELAALGQWEEIDALQPLGGGRMLRLKTLHIYFPDELLPICSIYHLQHFLEQVGVAPDETKALDAVGLNRRLLKELRTIPEMQGWTTKEMERFLYNWADPRDTRRIVKIAPGEEAKYWQDCLANGYICVGWDEVGDLREFESEDSFRQRFFQAYAGEYKGHQPTMTKKATEVWTLMQLEPGDVVVANQGISRILAIGEVVEPGYEWRPERAEYRHTVRVRWDATYAKEIEPVKRWALVTVAPVGAELYQRIMGKGGKGGDSPPTPPIEPIFPEIANALERKGQVILYGPPGTGKSYQARRFAVWWLSQQQGNSDAAALLADAQALAAAERRLSTVKVAQRVWWVVANPKEWSWDQLFTDKRVNYRYGRLGRNYPLVQPGDLVVGYQSTPDKRLVALARVSKGLHESAEGEPKIELEPVRRIQNGPTYQQLQADPTLKNSEPMRFRCQGTLFALTPDEAEYLFAMLSERDPELGAYTTGRESMGLLTWVTFHASYSYEDWIEGFRPVDTGTGGLVLRLEDGLFKRICREAQAHPSRRYLLVVDEINRANITKVLGELITLLEKDKRGLMVTLPQSKESFTIPPKVYILGTMNTADRSIRLLDTALRRRFAFVELMPDVELLRGAMVNNLALDDLLEALNRRIAAKEGREKQIGHAFLLDERDGQPISDPIEFARRFRQEILPLLQEYCYDDYGALAGYVGDQLVNVEAQTLITAVLDDPDKLIEALAKVVDAKEKAV